MTAQNRKTFVILLVCTLMDFIGFGVVMPILPFYAQSFGASPFEVGLLMGIFPLMGMVAPMIWGTLSDRIGRRPALLCNIAGSAFSYGLLSLSKSLSLLFLARALAGASSASIVIAQSYASDLSTTQNRTQTLSLLEAASGIGIVIGLLISGLLVGASADAPHFRLPLVVATVASGLTIGLGAIALPSAQPPSLGERSPTPLLHQSIRQSLHFITQDLKTTIQRPLISCVMLLVFALLFGIIGIESIFALWCEAFFSWGPQQFSALIVVYFLIVSLLQVSVTAHLARWWGETRLLLGSLILLSFGLVLRPFSTTLPLLLGSMAFVILAEAIGIPTITSLLSRLSGAKQQGKTLGLMQSIAGLGGGIGASSAGFLFGSVSHNAPYWFSAILIGGAALICWKYLTPTRLFRVMRRRQRKKALQLFRLLDRDRNGSLELSDFEQASHRLATIRGWAPHSHEYRQLQAFVSSFGQRLGDRSASHDQQAIDRQEWLNYLNDVSEQDLAALLLQMIDANQDGRITVEELKSFYQAYDLTTDHLEEIFRVLDLNQDGHISQTEFETIFHQFLHSDDAQAPGNWIFGVSLPRQL